MLFEYCLLAVVLGSVAVSLAYTAITGISPVSSTRQSRKRMLRSIPADQGGTIYELGAGWGAVAFPLARRCPDATVVAYELSPVPWLYMKLCRMLFGPHNLKVRRRNFFRENLEKASLVVCYLYPGAMEKLSSKLVLELEPRARVISNTFAIPSWTPQLVQNLEDVMCPQVFHYEMHSVIANIQQHIGVLSSIIG